jgi:hypothetical protein
MMAHHGCSGRSLEDAVAGDYPSDVGAAGVDQEGVVIVAFRRAALAHRRGRGPLARTQPREETC